MSQDSDSSASSEEYSNLMEQAEHEADASAEELAAMSSSTLKADPDGSFLGKVRTNVSNMISKLFRSPKEEANSPKHNQQNRLASIARASNDEGLRTIEQRKRKHSPSVSPSARGDHYAEMIRKRSRLNVATEAVTQPADTSLVNRLSRDSTPNIAQLCSSYSEIRRRPLSQSAAGRSLQMRRGATQSLSRRALADRSANRSGNRNIASGVGRISPWAVPSDSMPYGLSNKSWQSEFSNGHESEQDCISSTPRSTNSPIEEEIDGASVTSDKQEHPEGVDNLSYSAGGDRVSEPYVPFGNQQKFEAALKAANDPSRRYTTFLGNAVARQRSRSGSTSSLNFWSHLDHDKSLFRSGNTYERPAFNPSVYGNSSFSSYFYDGVPRYGGASAVPFNQSRLNGLRTPLPTKRSATETVVTSNTISTQSQIIQTILDSYSTQNAEKRRREANDLMRQEKTLMEKTRQLLESCNQTGSGLVRLRKPTTQSGLISQRLRNATSNNELLVPRMQQMMAISLLQKTNRARDCIDSQGTLCPQENTAARQTVSDELTAEKSNRARGEVAASDRRIGNPVVPIEYKAGQHTDLAASPNRVHSSVGTASSAHGEQAKPAKQLFAPDIVTVQHSASVGTSKVIAPNTPTYSNQPKASDAAVHRNGHLFVFSSPAILDPAVKGTSVIASTRYKFNGPQLLTRLVEEPTSFQQLIAATSAGNKWQCDVCSVWSEQSATKCVACESAKPQPKATASSASTRKSTNIATSNSTTGTANICRPLPPIHQFFESTVDNGPSNATELFGAQQTFFGSNGPTPKQLSSAVITISDESDDDEDSVCEVVADDSPVISTDSSTIPFDTTKNGTGEFYSSGIQFQPVDQQASQNYVAGAKWPLNVSLDGSNGNKFDSDGDKYTYEHKKAFDDPVFQFGSQPKPTGVHSMMARSNRGDGLPRRLKLRATRRSQR